MTSALVVDDNRLTAEIISQFLTMLGLQSTCVYSARQAFQAMRQQKPNVIFLDISMPGLNGLDVISFMSREPALAAIKIIIITALEDADVHQQARDMGALEVMMKPISIVMLEEVLKKHQFL